MTLDEATMALVDELKGDRPMNEISILERATITVEYLTSKGLNPLEVLDRSNQFDRQPGSIAYLMGIATGIKIGESLAPVHDK